MTVEQRFWLRVRKDLSCWTWLGAQHQGHGQWRGRYAHRVAWEFMMGAIPAGKLLMATCHNPLCVRPAHHVLVGQSYCQRSARSSAGSGGT